MTFESTYDIDINRAGKVILSYTVRDTEENLMKTLFVPPLIMSPEKAKKLAEDILKCCTRVEALGLFESTNETHELASFEKTGRGRIPQYIGISWAAKASEISSSLKRAAEKARSSRDPLSSERLFVIAHPVTEVRKRSSDKKKAPQGVLKETVDFGGEHARVFDRLGLDLLQVTEQGDAVVHAKTEKWTQLSQRAESLERLGVREQIRWVSIASFDSVPLELRVDTDWLKTLKPNQLTDIVIELQPVLTRVDVDRVLRAIADTLLLGSGEKLTGTGSDFSGRHWFRGKATRESVCAIAQDFVSIQTVHSPLFSIAAVAKAKRRTRVEAMGLFEP